MPTVWPSSQSSDDSDERSVIAIGKQAQRLNVRHLLICDMAIGGGTRSYPLRLPRVQGLYPPAKIKRRKALRQKRRKR